MSKSAYIAAAHAAMKILTQIVILIFIILAIIRFVFIDYENRKQSCEDFNNSNRWRKRGIAVVPMAWPLIYYGIMPAFVAIYHHDGSVVVSHGGIECGQGINTKVAQVTAHALGVPLENVSIRPMDNVVSANAVMTASSCTSEMVCYVCKLLSFHYNSSNDKHLNIGGAESVRNSSGPNETS